MAEQNIQPPRTSEPWSVGRARVLAGGLRVGDKYGARFEISPPRLKPIREFPAP